MRNGMFDKKKFLYFSVFILFLFISVGYAYLNSTLGISGQVSVKKYALTFADQSWDTIIANVRAGKTENYHLGDTKEIDMGSLGKHTLRIANMSTPAECATAGYSQTACGFVIEFADIITRQNMNSSEYIGGWPASRMREYLANTIFSALPTELQSNIIDTTVVSSHGSADSNNFTSSDKLYLLSTKEVWGKEGTSSVIQYDTAEAETRQLDYYKSIGVTTSNNKGTIKKNGNTALDWWLRSAYSKNNDYVYKVGSGGWSGYISAINVYGVSPAFRIG